MKQPSLTAVVTAQKIPTRDGTHVLSFYADYGPEENKVWAKYTPAVNFQMHVLDEVADKVENGDKFLVTFTPKDAV